MVLERIHPVKLKLFANMYGDLSNILHGKVIVDGYFDENDVLVVRVVYVDREHPRDECWIWDSVEGGKMRVDCDVLRLLLWEFARRTSYWENYRKIRVEA